MEIKSREIAVKDIYDGYKDDDEGGVYAYGGRLTIRPEYQREFCYDAKKSEAVIQTIIAGYPLNVMYWAKTGKDRYEIIDGQQRTLSVMHFLDHQFQIHINKHSFYEDSLTDDKYNAILNYKFMIYICDGTPTEKLAWFKIVNIGGLELTDQELRNAEYTGKWLTDAKLHFSKANCAAKNLSSKYLTFDPTRQLLLEAALKGITEYQGKKDVTDYMSEHRSDDDADELWQYFQDVFAWTQKVFPKYRSSMKGLDWCHLYNKYSRRKYNSKQMETDVARLHADEDVQKKKGIYEYLLSREIDPFAERKLSLRAFTEHDKLTAYERQNGICPICGRHFDISQMQADHVIPWSKGGKTIAENCQMLCTDCNRRKSNI